MQVMDLIRVGALLAITGPAFAEEPKTAQQATIVTLKNAVHRAVPSGKASIKVLAEGAQAFVGQLALAPHAAVPLHRDPT
jgi:hypothetical protein